MPPLLIIFFNIKKYFLMFCPVFVPHYLLLLFFVRPPAEKHIYYFYFSKFFSADMHPLWFFCPIVSLDDSFFLFLLLSCTASLSGCRAFLPFVPLPCSVPVCPGVSGLGWHAWRGHFIRGVLKNIGGCFKRGSY